MKSGHEITKKIAFEIPNDSNVLDTPDQLLLRNNVVNLLDTLEVDKQPSLYQRLKDRLMVASSEDTSLMLALSRYIKRKINI